MERDKLKKELPKRPTGIFYLENNRGFFYDHGLSSPVGVDFPPDMISDLEVISKKKIETAIQSLISNYKIVPENIIILLSTTVTFDKDFTDGTVQMEQNVQDFLELVPFQDYLSKKSKFTKKTKITAANRELCDVIKNAFVDCGFVVSSIIPLSACMEIMPNLQNNLDLGLILDKATDLRAYSLLTDQAQLAQSNEKNKKDNKRLFMLVGVFVFLILILIFVLYKYIFSAPKPVSALPVNNPTAPIPSVIAPSNSPTISPDFSSNFSSNSGVGENKSEAN